MRNQWHSCNYLTKKRVQQSVQIAILYDLLLLIAEIYIYVYNLNKKFICTYHVIRRWPMKFFKHFVRNGVCLLLDCCFLFLYMYLTFCVWPPNWSIQPIQEHYHGLFEQRILWKCRFFSQLLYDKFK